MKTWMKLLAVAAVVGLAVAGEVKGQACDIDEPGTTRRQAFTISNPKFMNCFRAIISDELMAEFREAKSLAEHQSFTSGFCTHASQFATCLASVRASYETCHNKNVSALIVIFADLVEHLLPGACENGGERLAYLLHELQMFTASSDSRIPLRRCLTKANSFLDVAENMDLDIASRTYLLYKELPKVKGCMKHMEDDAYKPALEWVSNELLSTLKCQHPEEDRLVLCSDIDVTKVSTTNMCKTKLLEAPNLYDHIEEMAIGCYTMFFAHDIEENNSTSLEELKKEYKHLCAYHRKMPYCLLRYSGFAESCLSQEEDKQFQLFAQSIEDFTERSCVDEGEWIATVMHEVYRQLPEHGNAWRDCANQDSEASKSHQGHAVSSKNMRFYHETIAFKQCVVDKLHANNDVSKGLENMINDVLKKMKCVSTEDGTAVLCETIHQH